MISALLTVGVYACLLIVGLVLSFKARTSSRRIVAGITTLILAIPGLLLLALIVVLHEAEPPTLADLQRDFPTKRADLETVLRMSDEDSKFSRIAPNFLDRETNDTFGTGRFMNGDPKAELPKPRWDAYRAIYYRNHIELGIQRDKSRDAFIMVDSIGLLNRGHTTGYLHCADSPSAGGDGFYPCLLHQEKGERKFNPDTRDEGYSFQRLDDHWYAYDEGPS